MRQFNITVAQKIAAMTEEKKIWKAILLTEKMGKSYLCKTIFFS